MLCKITATNTFETAAAIHSALSNGSKVIHIEKCHAQNIDEFYTVVAQTLGRHALMEENAAGEKTGAIHTDIKHPWTEYSNSYSHSQTRQPFHTDGAYESNAPQISYFYCKKQAEFGGSTIFIENKTIIEILNHCNNHLLNEVRSTKIQFHKGTDSKEKPIIDEQDNLTWNWHRCDHNLPITQEFNQFLESKIFEGGIYQSVNLKEREALFFKDETVLHGRHSFIGSRWLVKGGIHRE